MDTLSYFQNQVVESTWKESCNSDSNSDSNKWPASSPSQSSMGLESYSRTSPSLSFSDSSVFSSFLSQQDLLPELWLQSDPNTTEYPQQRATEGLEYERISNDYVFQSQDHADRLYSKPNNVPFTAWNHKPRGNPPPGLSAKARLHDSSVKYAQTLLPQRLLKPLTQANLDFHKTVKTQLNNNNNDIYPAEDHNTELIDKLLLHKTRNGSVSSTSSSGLSASSANSSTSSVSKTLKSITKSLNTQLYKTELCLSYMKTNVCPYGSKCQFAHGECELKRVERPLNWRSKPCANWARYGSCRYGKRCCFKHGE